MAAGDFVQGAYAEGLTGAIATLGATPTPGNTVVIFESVRAGGTGAAPPGFTISPAGTTPAAETAITAWSRIVQPGDGVSYDTGSRPGITLIWVEEREGALAFDAASIGATSPDPNTDPHFVGPTITPTAGYVGAVYGLFGWKQTGGVPSGTPDSPWTEVADHNFSVQSLYVESVDVDPTSGTYTSGLTNTGPVFDNHSYAAQTLALTTAPPAPPPPAPGVHLSIDGVELTDAFDIRIRIELNGTGWGSFKIKRSSPEATAAALTPGNYVLVTIPQIDPDPIFGFFLEGSGAPDTPTIILVSPDEEGGEFATFGGRGGLSYWERAIWLAESFLQKWWPQYKEDEAGPPASTDIGALALSGDPGWYYHYTVSGSTVTGKTLFHTDAVTAYYDHRQVFTRADGSKITLVQFSDTVYNNYWVHPFGAGVVDYRKKSVYAFGNSILMESVATLDQPGVVIYKMFEEANAADRPIHPLAAMTIDFDESVDSDGNLWTATEALRAVSTELGDDYLSTIGKMVNTGVVDVEMDPDLGMHAYNAPHGRALTGTDFGLNVVRFVKGVNIADELDREYSDQPTATFAEVQGSEEGAIARVTIAGSPPREISVRGDSADTTVLESLGEAELALRQLHSDTVAFGVDTPIVGHEDPDNGLYLPGPVGTAHGNYWPGDSVTLHTGSAEHDFDDTTVRVAAVTITMTDANDLRVIVEVISGFGGIPTLGSPSSSGPTAGATAGAPSTISDLYQLLSERDQVRGYPSLDDDGLVSYTELPTQWKQSVRVAATGNVNLTTDVDAGSVLDGETLVEGDSILLPVQTSALQNGLYLVPASGGTAQRRGDFNADVDVVGAHVYVREGTANAGTYWRTTNLTDPVVGTDAIDWEQTLATGAGSGSVDTATDGSTTVSDPDTIEITGTGGIAVSVSESPSGTALYAIDGSGISGGGGATAPTVVQVKYAGTTISSITLDSAPASGHTVLLYCDAFNTADPTAVSSTNTTWTKIKSVSAGAKYSLWVGVVAGGAGGTVITITHANSFLSAFAIEVTDTLTGTLGTNTSAAANVSASTSSITSGHLVAIMGGCDNTTVANSMSSTLPNRGFSAGIVWGVVSYATGNPVYALMTPNAGTLMIAEIT